MTSNRYNFYSIAENRSGGYLAAKVTYVAQGKVDEIEKGTLYFLPLTTKCSRQDAIEILLDIILEEERARYNWWDHIEVPGSNEIKKQISGIDNRTSELEKEKQGLSKQLNKLLSYRDLLSADNISLVEIVRNALNDLGIVTQNTEPRKCVDLIGRDIAIEVTGTVDKVDNKNKKLAQLLTAKGELPDKKLILVANTYKRDSPDIRRSKTHFTKEALKVMESLESCAITSQTLFEYWRLSKKEPSKKDEFKVKIYKTNGELIFPI